MAFVTFDFMPSGGDTQTSGSLTLGVGEAARACFTADWLVIPDDLATFDG